MTLEIVKDKTELEQPTAKDIKLKLAEALNTIVELQAVERYPQLSAQERYELFNEALGCLCDTLGIDLDMYEHYVKGDISREDYEDLNALEVSKTLIVLPNIKSELQDLYSLNDSMFTGDPNHIPKYTDGTIIKPQDLADMNMNSLEQIAEMIGIELDE